jgi:hypothetical protein
MRRSRYIPARGNRWRLRGGRAMRAEVQTIVDDIKQSIGLLRRHL